MLIINADDWGKNKISTDRILACFNAGRITSASAMVFMKDSERSAERALEANMDTGLHVNYTLAFDGSLKSDTLAKYHRRISRFLLKNKYAFLIYNPLLRNEFEYVYRSQYEEFFRLYNRAPSHIDGHHHMHLCTNVLLGGLIQQGAKIRRNFTFSSGEKNCVNRFYRRVIDKRIMRKYKCTDFFFSISPVEPMDRIWRILHLSVGSNVELMAHPERPEEFDFLMSIEFLNLLSPLEKVSYSAI